MANSLFLFLCVMREPATALRHTVMAPRRQIVLAAAATAPWLHPTSALAVDLDDGPIFIPSPSGIFRYALKRQTQKQEACYEAGECVDKVPYYRIEC